ncbi:MAG: type 4b pilus protein PilO2 [Burkholderiales bacterium]|nr:type 4b pilus protein PilO2 [Burkholderiales bacterium]
MSSNFGLVQIEGRSYCAGLFWYPLDGSGRAAELDDILAEQNAAFYVTRGHPPAQVGLLDAETAAQRGAVSIAAAVADRLTAEGLRNFLVALPTDVRGQWCYVAQNQELIQFDGDLAGPAEDVRERMQQHMAAAVEWQLIVAPPEWNIAGAVQRERSAMLPTGRSFGGAAEPRLRAVQRRASGGEGTSLAAMLCVAVLLAEAAVGYAVWRTGSQRLEARQADAALEQQTFTAKRPWLEKPDFGRWAPVCARAVASHAMNLAGWNVSRIVCHPATASLKVEWTRSPGALFEHLQRLQPQARLAPHAREPAQASLQVKLQAPAEPMLPVAPNELMRRADWQGAASRWAEQWREQRPQFSPEAAGGIGWSLSGDMPPAALLRSLALPGSVLGAIEFDNPTDGKTVWTVKATHYVQD